MYTNKIVFLQHDKNSFTGTTDADGNYVYGDSSTRALDNNGNFVYGQKITSTLDDMVGSLETGSATAKLAFPTTKVQTDLNSAKISMGVSDIDSYTEADSITWTLNDDKTELTMTAQFSQIDNLKTFQTKIESRDPWATVDVYQDKSKGEYGS